jgi:rubrerythrin
MSHIPTIGDNRTGIARYPRRTAAMVKGTREFPPSSRGSDENLAAVRIDYAREALPIGTLPPALDAKPSESTIVFLDKLGARLAFERTGVRLYDGILAKHKALGSFDGGPSRAELERIRNEEHAHFMMLRQAAESLGADPTAVTPSADVQAVTSVGVLQVISDPRTTLLASLDAILIAELADNDGWECLIELARHAGHDGLAERFASALRDEVEHLENVRRWLAAGEGRTRALKEQH